MFAQLTANPADLEKSRWLGASRPFSNPMMGGCAANEVVMKVDGVAGSYCAPACSTSCPSISALDIDASTVAGCVIALPSETTATHCALLCQPQVAQSCPQGSTCKVFLDWGRCTFD